MFWTFIFSTIFYLIARWIFARQRQMKIIAKMRIKGPEPNLLFGNINEFGEKGLHRCLEEWTKQYGKTFGYYEGYLPIVVTSDADILKQVFIKEFSKFHKRKPFPMDSDYDHYQDMFSSHGEKWKRLRSNSSPSFSVKRMKEMSPLINQVVDRMMVVMEEKADKKKPFDIYDIYGRMTLDVIGCCAFGVDVNSLQDPKDPFLYHCREIFSLSEEPPKLFIFVSMLGYILPSWINAFRYVFPNSIPFPRDWLLNKAKEIIMTRKENRIGKVDFIQLMIDAEDGHGATEHEYDNGDGDHVIDRKHKQKLSIQEMQAQCFLFLLAGYETTSTALAFLTYELALNPDIQTKMQEEIDDHFNEADPRPDYVTVMKLPYMEMVICETLRLHPIATIANTRQCVEEVEINGITFPAGVNVQANIAAIHKDKDLWGPEDPEKFVPERFLPERKATRHPMAWLPFGAGPRNCVGMRFALMEAKISLVRMLKKYSILKCDETKVPIEVQKHSITTPTDGIMIKLCPRS